MGSEDQDAQVGLDQHRDQLAELRPVRLDRIEHGVRFGARDNQWTLEGIDWTTGKSTFHYILGGARFNSFYSQPVIDMDGRVMVSGLYGAMRIQPKK